MWLARRFVGGLGRRAAVVLVLAPLLFTGKAMLLGRLYGPSDLYFGGEPWSRIAAQSGVPTAAPGGVAKIANPILSDLAFANLPWRAAVREAVGHGRFPFWNRFVLGGTPLLAAAQAAIFHPSTWLAIFLPLPLSWTFSCSFTLFLALLAGFLLFRDFALSETAALAGAVGWGFSTYMIFWNGWSVGTSIAALPLLLLGLRRIVAGASGSMGLTVAALLLLVAGGHPESWLHGAAAAGVFFVWELLPRRRADVVRGLGRAVGAAVLAFLLAAPQLFPLLEAIPHSAEYRARREMLASGRSRQSVAAAESARRMLPAVLPFAYGIFGKSPVQSERADGSGVPLAYAGAMLFPLAALGLFSKRRVERGRTIFVLLAAAGVLAGASAPGLLDVLTRLPGFSLALNYRLVFLAGLGLAGLAAFGVDAIGGGERRRAPGLALACAAILLAAALLARGVYRERDLPAAFVATSLGFEVAPLLLFVGLAAFPRFGGPAVAAGALLLLAGQRALEMGGTYPTLPASTLAPRLEALDGVGASGPARVVALGDVFRPNAAALYGVEDVRGYESIVLDRLADTFPSWSVPQAASFNRVDDLQRPFLRLLNVRYALAPPDSAAPQGWRAVSRDAAASLLENPAAMDRAFVPETVRRVPDGRQALQEMKAADDFSATVWLEGSSSPRSEANGRALLELRESGPDLVVAADADAPTLVATSLPAWPGWRARAGGRELEVFPVDHAFVGFFVPRGRSLVRLTYRPDSWGVGVACAVAGALGAIGSVLARRS